jgi:hypothetical protein
VVMVRPTNFASAVGDPQPLAPATGAGAGRSAAGLEMNVPAASCLKLGTLGHGSELPISKHRAVQP